MPLTGLLACDLPGRMDFLVIVAVIGSVFGVVGFARAGRALAELRELRRMLAPPAGAVAPDRPAPASVPQFGPEAYGGARVEPVPLDTPEPVAARMPAAAAPAKRDIEALLTLRWGIWLGAAALLMAGVFLVRYAADEGWLGPPTRCLLAAMLGLALLAGAEVLARRPAAVRTGRFAVDQSPAALAAGGIGVLFGAAYAYGPFYDLVPPLAGFVLLALAAFAGLAASLRFGQLVAAVGIVGALVTPLLVATDNPTLPGLFGYLLVVTAAALAVVRYRAWIWLGWATTIAAAAWVIAGAEVATTADAWAPALFVPAAAALNLFLLPSAALEIEAGRLLCWVPFAVLGVSGLVLQATAPGAMPRLGLLLLSPVAVAKGIRERRLDRLPWVAALFGVLALLFWDLPAWSPTGEAVTIDGVVQAILPGSWAPEVVQMLLATAAMLAGFHAGSGLVMERRAARPLPWAALPAAVPLLVLIVSYAQVARFQPDIAWAFAALALMAALTVIATLAARENAPRRAGVHAAGAVAALAFGCAILLRDQWLTLAIALYLPPLAWIEARADLPALRRVALVVAALVLVRLLLNPGIFDYAFGATPVLNGLLLTYGVPAACFALAARLFRKRGNDATVAVLEAGAIAFVTLLVALEIRHAATAGRLAGATSFGEMSLDIAALALQAFGNLWLWRRTGRPIPGWAWRVQGTVALLGGVGLLIANPLLVADGAGSGELAIAYLLPAVLAALAALALRWVGRAEARLLGSYAGVAMFVWIGLQIRQMFHPDAISLEASPITDAESWCWSGGWLVYGAALLTVGIRRQGRGLRLAALATVGLVTAKVFLIDMADLGGLWRVLSFLGLGLALIGLGAVYRRFVVTDAGTGRG
jgi:uncharacterized membrane protein